MTKSLKAIVAANVRHARLRLGMTQEELAKRTLSVRYISKVENDPPDVTLHNLDRIAKGLGVPVAELVSEPKTKLPKPSTKNAESVRHTIRILEAYLDTQGIKRMSRVSM